MTELIITLTDKTGYKHIKQLIENNEWENIFVIINKDLLNFADFTGEVGYIEIDDKKRTEDITSQLISTLKENISGMEVALNMFSGSGKVHMATLSALLKLGIGIRLVKQGKEKIEEL